MTVAPNNVNRVVYDLSFVEDGINELPYDQRQKINYTKLLSVVLKRVDNCQKEAIKLAYLRFLDNAVGDMLDGIAANFFIERRDKTDADLRASIKLFALRQISSGTREDIYKILRVLTTNGFVKIYKGEDNYIEVCLAIDCVSLRELKEEVRILFPINTNLRLCEIPIIGRPFGVGSNHSTRTLEEMKIGVLGSNHTTNIVRNLTAVTHINDEAYGDNS